jgi:hypothetical protein
VAAQLPRSVLCPSGPLAHAAALLALCLLLATPAAAGRLDEMDGHLQQLEQAGLGGPAEAIEAELNGLVEVLGELRRLADQPPPHLARRARLRMGEGFLQLAPVLLEGDCAEGLDEESCSVWRSELGLQADPMLMQAGVWLGPLDEGRLPAAERARLVKARELLGRLESVPVEPIDPPGLPAEAPIDDDLAPVE